MLRYTLLFIFLLSSAYADSYKKSAALVKKGLFKDALPVITQGLESESWNLGQMQNALRWLKDGHTKLKSLNDYTNFLERASQSQRAEYLWAQAEAWQQIPHYGKMLDGQFIRGQSYRYGRNGYISEEKDRRKALHLMSRAEKSIQQIAQNKRYRLYWKWAEILKWNRDNADLWRLQEKTPWTKKLVAEKYSYRYSHNSAAPVDGDGKIVLYEIPQSAKSAKNDGELLRYCWKKVEALDSRQSGQLAYARFLENQFGVRTLSTWFGNRRGVTKKLEMLEHLNDDESLANLAIGVRQVKLPKAHNYISIYKEFKRYQELAQIYEDRHQLEKAAEMWRKYLAKSQSKWAKERLEQITGDWGHFEHSGVYSTQQDVSLPFRFRNAKKLYVKAYEIKLDEYFTDLKAYLRSNPKQLDWQKMNLSQIGYQIVQKNKKRYLGALKSSWDVKLNPTSKYQDTRQQIPLEVKKSGLYLVEARLPNGRISETLVWLNDTMLQTQQLNGKKLYYLCDAENGQPIADAELEFFGYKVKHRNLNKAQRVLKMRRMDILIDRFSGKTNEDGEYQVHEKDRNGYRYLAFAKKGDRWAVLDFQSFYHYQRSASTWKQQRAFIVADRPLYQPGDSVKFKGWLARAQYGIKKQHRHFSSLNLRIYDPQHKEVYKKNIGGNGDYAFDGEWTLPGKAKLGVYTVSTSYGTFQFRVEEYKKPEFFVKFDLPKESLALGEKVKIKISADYYFGAPVSKGKMKVKITRQAFEQTWYPWGPWDWFYGNGYGWIGEDYPWYPTWRSWGCKRPYFWWYPQPTEPSELIYSTELVLNKDGFVEVEVDSSLAKKLYGDQDHRYSISAEVTDSSRRMVKGQGTVTFTRQAFNVSLAMNRSYYHQDDKISANIYAYIAGGKMIPTSGEMRLFKISYDDKGVASEKLVQKWPAKTVTDEQQPFVIKAPSVGQYRLTAMLKDQKGRIAEGGQIIQVRSSSFKNEKISDFRYNKIELLTDKVTYQPGDKLKILINTEKANSHVLLYLRPENGVYPEPIHLQLQGKSTIYETRIDKVDQPNIFIEAMTVYAGKAHSIRKEILVPPAKKILNVEMNSEKKTYEPGEEVTLKIKVRDAQGIPTKASLAMTVYDKSLEGIAGQQYQDIKAFFWKWRRSHYSRRATSNFSYYFSPLYRVKAIRMQNIGRFANYFVREGKGNELQALAVSGGRSSRSRSMKKAKGEMLMADMAMEESDESSLGIDGEGQTENQNEDVEVRTKLADAAYWNPNIDTDENGEATVTFIMPENLSTWQIRSWAMGEGTKVGQAEKELITSKKLLLRLQAPRFFVEKDEVVLSANVHSFLDTAEKVKVILETSEHLKLIKKDQRQFVSLKAHGEARVDWRVKVLKEGQAWIRMKVIGGKYNDAMQQDFSVKVHGAAKTVSWSGFLSPESQSLLYSFNIPEQRRTETTRLEVRYSPSLAMSMVDALPYLVSYPYGCTEQTLSRFLPTVLTQRTLQRMGLNLEDIRQKRTNLNAQQIGDDQERAKDWKRRGKVVIGYDEKDQPIWSDHPVFDEDKVRDMQEVGIKRLLNMQLADGGWGWFSGYGERSSAHTTAYVLHGFSVAKENGVKIPGSVIKRGLNWLRKYQNEELTKIENYRAKRWKKATKQYADNIDAFVYMVLAENKEKSSVHQKMAKELYHSRTQLAVYGKAMFALALHKQHGNDDRVKMLKRNIEQYLKVDKENQTAYLDLPNNHYWWNWYGSEYEAQAYYLKLLVAVEAKGKTAPALVKYLLNNRRNSTYWNSTRDTAICIEAFADYLKATKEGEVDMTLEILVDGKKQKELRINRDNLFSYDNQLVIEGLDLSSGQHQLEIRRKGKGPLYANAYLSYFSLEDHITKTGLEVKVERRYYRLHQLKEQKSTSGSHGQVTKIIQEKYRRELLQNLDMVKSGDLLEVELSIISKNDYEYLLFEDYKPAGCETLALASGYVNDGFWAYRELRNDRVAFFIKNLPRGKHNLRYRTRAEIPGKFSALPTQVHAMYAPEIRANSDEIKIKVVE